jgi:hypothetical protein
MYEVSVVAGNLTLRADYMELTGKSRLYGTNWKKTR